MRIIQLNSGTISIPGDYAFIRNHSRDSIYQREMESLFFPLAIKSYLIEKDNRKILIDTGIGSAIDNEFLAPYKPKELRPVHTLLDDHNIDKDDITDVILTHLHFDHCGGCVIPENINGNSETVKYKVTFPLATHWIAQSNWTWAFDDTKHEPDSYLSHTFIPLLGNGMIKFVFSNKEILPGISVRLFYGHTFGLMVLLVQYKNRTLAFPGDLIPTSAYIPVENIMKYDINPSLAEKEKELFLNEALKGNYILCFQHDTEVECCDLKLENRKVVVKSTFRLPDL